jgi:hypothetical protein
MTGSANSGNFAARVESRIVLSGGALRRPVRFIRATDYGVGFCPTGKSAKIVSSPLCKNISVFQKYKSGYMICRPVPLEGRFAIVTDAGRDAVDADALLTNGAEADGEGVWS